jgi:predicted  nucleic acid-binding Zn-ribbon protein
MTVAINEQIKILVELQKIDSEIFRLKKELASHPETEKRIAAEFEKKKAGLKAAEEEAKALQVKQKSKEVDLAQREEKITKLTAQLYQLKSNKEYSAMELEIKGLKADKSLLEEDILKLLDAVDEAKKKVAKEKEALAQEEKKHQAELAELKKRADELQAGINAGEEKRKTYTPNVEARSLSQYERILKSRDGLALVPVVNNACGGCHLGLPPQVVNETQKHEKWIVCESCARILYWPW